MKDVDGFGRLTGTTSPVKTGQSELSLAGFYVSRCLWLFYPADKSSQGNYIADSGRVHDPQFCPGHNFEITNCHGRVPVSYLAAEPNFPTVRHPS